MNFKELARSRYSCRKYLPNTIEEQVLKSIFETVRAAPSAVNYQPWHFIIVRSPEQKEKVIESYPREWIRTAPVLLIACADHQKSWKRSDGKDHSDIDLAIAIDHLMLQAAESGLGTCWVCNFKPYILRQHFQLPEYIEPIAIIPIGYPEPTEDPDRHLLNRLDAEQFLHWESF